MVTGRELVGVRLPSQLKDRLDRETQPNQAIVEAALKRHLGTDEAAVLELRLENRLMERDRLVEERDALDRKIDELEADIASLESRLEEVEADRQSYKETLDSLLDVLADGNHVWPGHGKVEALEDSHDVKPEAVIEDLKDLADERDLDIPERRFQDGAKGGGRR